MLDTITSTSILEGLHDAENQTAWRHYVDRYRPLIVRFATHMGVSQDDAEDVAQETLLAFSGAYREGRYERAKGRLRSWLFGMARHKLEHFLRGRVRRPTEPLDTAVPPAALDNAEDLWDREWRDALVAECLNQIRTEVQPVTYAAFQLFALEENPARHVADELGLSENAVFLAKSRILRRLKELMPLMEEIW